MATYTPPPYFPQGPLAPPDGNRYKKFKLAVLGLSLILLLFLVGFGVGVWYFVKWIM